MGLKREIKIINKSSNKSLRQLSCLSFNRMSYYSLSFVIFYNMKHILSFAYYVWHFCHMWKLMCVLLLLDWLIFRSNRKFLLWWKKYKKISVISLYHTTRKTVHPISELHRISIKPKHTYVVFAFQACCYYFIYFGISKPYHLQIDP